jgi:hypothetical protein
VSSAGRMERDDRGEWHKRRGRVQDGYLDEKAAIVELHRLIEEHEAELASAPSPTSGTFAEAAADWLHRLEHVDGVKPSTLADDRLMLTPPDVPAHKRGRRTGGRIMAAFGASEVRIDQESGRREPPCADGHRVRLEADR